VSFDPQMTQMAQIDGAERNAPREAPLNL